MPCPPVVLETEGVEDRLFPAAAAEDVVGTSAASSASHRNYRGLDDVEQGRGLMQGVVVLHSFPSVSECVNDDDGEYGCCLKGESVWFQIRGGEKHGKIAQLS